MAFRAQKVSGAFKKQGPVDLGSLPFWPMFGGINIPACRWINISLNYEHYNSCSVHNWVKCFWGWEGAESMTSELNIRLHLFILWPYILLGLWPIPFFNLLHLYNVYVFMRISV